MTRQELESYRRASDRMRRLDAYSRIRAEAEEKLKDIENPWNKLIRLRYFKRYQWVAVSQRMHYSLRQCYRIDREAMRKILEDDDAGND